MWSNFQCFASLSRIDRFLYCSYWEDIFPNQTQVALSRVMSDHHPIKLEQKRFIRGPIPFKFKDMWFLEEDFMEVVEVMWNNEVFFGNPSRIFVFKLKALKVNLKAWNKNSGDSFKAKLEECLRKIKGFDLVEEERRLSPLERGERESEKGVSFVFSQRRNFLKTTFQNIMVKGGG